MKTITMTLEEYQADIVKAKQDGAGIRKNTVEMLGKMLQNRSSYTRSDHEEADKIMWQLYRQLKESDV